MSDHYRTLGLQPDASKREIRNAYFRLAHRYHPDHHAQADAAGRAAAAARFRKAKDAYDVLIDDDRRAEYDRIVRPSSSASGKRDGQYGRGSSSSASGNRHGKYGGGASSSSPNWQSSSSTDWDSSSSTSTDWFSDFESKLESLRLVQEELARAQRGDGGRAYSSSSTHGDRHGQYTSSRRHGGASSSTDWGHDRGSRRRPRLMGSGTALFLCCAAVIGGSVLLWSMFKRESADKKGGELADKKGRELADKEKKSGVCLEHI